MSYLSTWIISCSVTAVTGLRPERLIYCIRSDAVMGANRTGSIRTGARNYPHKTADHLRPLSLVLSSRLKDVLKPIDRRRWDMQAAREPGHAAVPRSHGRPILDSCDSGEEFSFYHWIGVCKLVDEADEPPKDEGARYSAEF